MIVLDASAFLAYLLQEPGHAVVGPYMESCCISTVNLSEVLDRFGRLGLDAQALLAKLYQSSVELVPFTAEAALLAAQLQSSTQQFGLSLGDRACLALALTRALPVLTADRSWSHLQLRLDIRQIRS